jgi:hypothetical protein
MSFSQKNKSKRYYCPVCGTVREAYRHWAQGWIVEGHTRFTRDAWKTEHCRGGPIDPECDKAP